MPSVLWLVVGVVALVRVHPHDAVTQPGQPLHGVGQQLGIAPVEAVGADHHDAAAAQPRRPQLRTKSSSDSPILVPPSQSTTSFAARSSASSGLRLLQRFGDRG